MKKNFFRPAKFVAVALTLVIFYSGCKKSSETNTMDPTELSGTWKGRIKIEKLGICTMNTSEYNIVQDWKVDNSRNVNIVEALLLGTDTLNVNAWTGTIDTKNQITIKSTQQRFCFGVADQITLELNGTIKAGSSSKTLDATVFFPVCPPECIFNQVYSITKL